MSASSWQWPVSASSTTTSPAWTVTMRPSRATQHQAGRAAGEAQHLVRGRVEVVERVDPLRQCRGQPLRVNSCRTAVAESQPTTAGSD